MIQPQLTFFGRPLFFGRNWHRGPTAALSLLGFAAVAIAFLAPVAPRANAGRDLCAAPMTVTALADPLPHTALRLAAGKSLTIVALGSSSTYGTGASKPEYSYPSRLAALLRARYPNTEIRVINRGVGGELIGDTTQRIATEVVGDKADLVIWQVGTNDVLSDADPQSVMASVRTGITQLHQAGADVILMDLQYAPAVLTHRYRAMERALLTTARTGGVAVFQRFALMRDWTEHGNMKMSAMVSADHLHMTDASYDCLARQLSGSIQRDTQIATDALATKG
ncbi:MAG TPA: SGNH/GDSL hydrolase family protein [Stellaceae bacterium]|jgi:lysophospholipase L1-like esterase|nr:SGNH/GDSL hydrolase family protein [Stellaceae bacterium]